MIKLREKDYREMKESLIDYVSLEDLEFCLDGYKLKDERCGCTSFELHLTAYSSNCKRTEVEHDKFYLDELKKP